MAKEAAAAEVVEEATATIIAYFLQLIINNLFGSRNTQPKSKRGKQRASQREEVGKKRSEERVRAKLRINSSNSSPGERPNLPQIETPDCLSLPSCPFCLSCFVAASDSHCERVNCCHKVYAGWMSALKSACACKHHIKTSRGDRHASPARPGSESKSERGAENIPLPSCPPTAAASAAALDHRLCSDFGLTHGPDSRPCLPASLWLQRVLRQQFVLLAQP